LNITFGLKSFGKLEASIRKASAWRNVRRSQFLFRWFSSSQIYRPVPLRGMSIVGLLGSLEVISKLAVFGPLDVGLKATLTVKLLPALIVLLPLPLVIVNIDSSVPVIAEVIERLPLPIFLITKEAVLLLFTFTFPKSYAIGVTEILGMLMLTDKEFDQFDTTEVSVVHRALAFTL